ncbi:MULTISPECIES: hypothetical protein [Comamonas]|uniref:hypothetical protein n=1 Tax=Comamonas TaxID=283 RepID=UPI000A7605A7|nr:MULTISPECIES: hypothetical protein [Comamonas]MBD9533538.1 hypothetical protein [Comamonas sp. CMM01]MBV7420774.1 hypothetical protein [Comamonas sp. CMM03]BBL26244.1 hypothetical protein CT3_36990 [Comamonas terrigena NBRC 13299]SUY70185.1 Uncharacterised protein [Comamonas terrigena]
MSDAASTNQLGLSSELLRWLRLLVLPLWARVVIFGLMIVVVVGGLTMLAYGLWAQKDDMASRAMQLITLSLPVLVVVLALVFGQNSDAKLLGLTHQLLGKDFPRTLGQQLHERVQLGDPVLGPLSHTLQGAEAEGYLLNPSPGKLQCADGSDCQALILYRSLPKDFLLEPAQRLYFIQDLSFFMAGVWHALHTKAPRT